MQRLLIALSIVVVLSGLCVSSVLAAEAEWPTFRGPNGEGKSPDTGLLKEWPTDGPKLLWKADGVGTGFSSVAVSGGVVYASGHVGRNLVLFAFDMEGKLKWKVAVCKAFGGGPKGTRATPTVDGGKIYLLSGAGRMSVLDAATGKELWLKEARAFGGRAGGWGYAESVLIHKNLAIFKPGGKNCIVALNKATGQTVWTSKGIDAGPEYGSCLPFTWDKATWIATGTRRGLVCVSAVTGEVKWTNPWSSGNTANCPTPVFGDGHVFWSNGYGRGGVCMKLGEGGEATEAWTTKNLVCHHGGYIFHEGHVYGNHGGGWSCLDIKTGEKKWNARGVGKGSVVWADGMLYLFGESGGQAALATCSPEGFEIKGKVKVAGRGPSWAHPAVIGGRLYLRYDDNLYCFDVKAK